MLSPERLFGVWYKIIIGVDLENKMFSPLPLLQVESIFLFAYKSIIVYTHISSQFLLNFVGIVTIIVHFIGLGKRGDKLDV